MRLLLRASFWGVGVTEILFLVQHVSLSGLGFRKRTRRCKASDPPTGDGRLFCPFRPKIGVKGISSVQVEGCRSNVLIVWLKVFGDSRLQTLELQL